MRRQLSLKVVTWHAEEEGYVSEFGRQSYSAKRLRDFVPRAAHILQQSEMTQFGPLEHLRLAQTALRMGRQVSSWKTET